MIPHTAKYCRDIYFLVRRLLGCPKDVGIPCEGDDECPVCFSEKFAKLGRKTKCGHRFCRDCLLAWIQQSNECPVCRQHL